MVLFVEIEEVLVQKCFRKESYKDFRHIIINEKAFNWIKEQKFEKIYIVSNQEGIEKGWLNEALFDLELQYISKSLELFTNTPVHSEYFPYKKANGYLIKDLMDSLNISEENALLLGNKKVHQKDAIFCDIEYVDLKTI